MPLGRVRTGISVRAREPMLDIGNREALRQTLLAAAALYLPDIEPSTVGVHAIGVLRALDIHADLIARVRAFANGATATRELATAYTAAVATTAQQPVAARRFVQLLTAPESREPRRSAGFEA